MSYPKPDDRVGLVLSGGGARGFAHSGVLKVLEQHHITPSAVAGTSMGAIIGALYASGLSADDITDITEKTPWNNLLDVSLRAGIVGGDKLHALLETYLPARFEDLAMPLAVTTTDIESGEQVVLTSGDVILAVRASSCFPGAFDPIELDGRLLIDGGVLNNLPINAIDFAEPTFTIASSTVEPKVQAFELQKRTWWQQLRALVNPKERATLVQATIRAVNIMQSTLLESCYEKRPADLLIKHGMEDVYVEDFQVFEQIIEAGEMRAREVLGEAQALI